MRLPHRPDVHLVFANKLWWRCDGEANVLSPHGAVELNVSLINLSITAEDEDIETLNWGGAWVQNESPAPSNDIAGVPDVESGDLVYAIAGVSMSSLDTCLIWLGDGSVGLASEEVDAIGDLLIICIGNRLDKGVEGCCLVARWSADSG